MIWPKLNPAPKENGAAVAGAGVVVMGAAVLALPAAAVVVGDCAPAPVASSSKNDSCSSSIARDIICLFAPCAPRLQ